MNKLQTGRYSGELQLRPRCKITAFGTLRFVGCQHGPGDWQVDLMWMLQSTQ